MVDSIKETARDDDFFTAVDDEDDDSMENKYMTFRVGDESFGIDIKYILEIIELQKITEVPDMPVFTKGVINLRGKIIPVMDLRLRFKLEKREYDDRTCIIVTDINNTPVGFVVDTVEEVSNITGDNIEPPPKFKAIEGKERYIKGLGKIGDDVKIILDIEKILFGEEMKAVRNLAEKKINIKEETNEN